jgi:hypothetical protein
MKKIYKILLILIALCAALVAIWYFYFFKRFSTLQDVDRQTILESFKPDSDGDGLSDFANKALEEDFNKITNLTTEEKESLKFWTIEYIKSKRFLALSENRDVYLQKAKTHYKIFKCSNLFLYKLGSNKYSFIYEEGFEENNFDEILNTLEKKNFRFLNELDIYNIQNPKMTVEKCQKLKEELKL